MGAHHDIYTLHGMVAAPACEVIVLSLNYILSEPVAL